MQLHPKASFACLFNYLEHPLRTKILAGLSALAVAIGVVAFSASSADATHPTVSGVAVCNTATGLFDITWTVGGDLNYWKETATIKYQSVDTSPTLLEKSVKGSTTVTATQNGVSAGKHSLLVKVQWTNHSLGNLVSQWGSVTTSGDCKIPTPDDASAAATPTPATCDAPGNVTFSVDNATWANTTDINDGSRRAFANKGHLFPGGFTTIDVGYVIQPQLSGTQCEKLVAPVAPTVKNSYESCNITDALTAIEPGSIALATGDWTWRDGHQKVVNGTQSVAKGSYTFTAIANPGVIFDDSGSTTKTFTVVVGFDNHKGSCLINVVPVTPKVTATDTCGTANDTLTVDSTQDHVTYAITWNQGRSGATVTETITDSTKYSFGANVQTVWKFKFTNRPCVIAVPVVPTASAQSCALGQRGVADTLKTGGVNVGTDTNLEYTITGKGSTVYAPAVATGRFTALAPGDYTVSVKALNGFVLSPGATSQWSVTENAGKCSPTLAYTGSTGNFAGLLLAGGFLLSGGTAIAFERRFRNNMK